MIYTCIKCDKTFKQKSGFIDHMNRKKPCIDNKIECNIFDEKKKSPKIPRNSPQHPPKNIVVHFVKINLQEVII